MHIQREGDWPKGIVIGRDCVYSECSEGGQMSLASQPLLRIL
jgi:hypothetical protein